MEERTFSFKVNINGKIKNLSFSIPIREGYVITNKYCPQELLTGGLPFVTAINGESIAEFISDCQAQVNAFTSAQNNDTKMNLHISGLISVIESHIKRCKRLIFWRFAYLYGLFQLSAASRQRKRKRYPRCLSPYFTFCCRAVCGFY